MSTTTTTGKRPYAQALQDALAFQRFFNGHAIRWEIAGSLRRRSPEVGDVEHVVIPCIETRPGRGLFAEPVQTNLVLERLDELVADGTATKHVYGGSGFRWGEKYRGVDFNGFTHEVFVADVDNWGPTLAIRTGPAEFSKTLVQRLYHRQHRNQAGYVWSCRFCDACSPEQSRSLTCMECAGTGLVCVERVSVPTEQEYFALASLPYLEPQARRLASALASVRE